MQERVKKRSSNFELLRIISMFMIILGHYALGSNWYFKPHIYFKREIVEFLWIGGRLGVILFTLISGYFLATGKFKWKSLLNNWLEVIFYSWLFMIVIKASGTSLIHMTNMDILKNVFPVTFGVANWYATAYIILYLLSPFINKLIHSLTKHQYRMLLGILIFFISICGVFLSSPAVGSNGYDVTSLFVIYLIGGYIRLFPEDFTQAHLKRYIWVFIGALIIGFLSVLMVDYINFHATGYFKNKYRYLYFLDGNSPIQLVAGTSLFLTFKFLPLNHSKVINSLASTMFGVYLMHSNYFIVGPLWNNLVRGFRFNHTIVVLAYGALVAVAILAVGAMIDYLRQWLMRFLDPVITKVANKLQAKNIY
ncbi:acyltransferase [Lactobacillus sp. CC-MHH1034]|uniref:acyltransferase family protein n=1 Tax=Agrilactobacillus fermenti TaxID=2586909 RepID=UPI001E4ECB25|nr:acyltransferase [Agrilactobacillus fermenti]MCD2256633.1 acyltransferase [Agrilactobacillus fermenti]